MGSGYWVVHSAQELTGVTFDPVSNICVEIEEAYRRFVDTQCEGA